MMLSAATGATELLAAIAGYYNHFYGTRLQPENVCVFAGAGWCGTLPG